MADIGAIMAIGIDARPAQKGASDIEQAGKKAVDAIDKVDKSTKKADKSSKQLGDEMKRTGEKGRKAGKDLDEAGKQITKLDKAQSAAIATAKRLVVAYLGFRAIKATAGHMIAFEQALVGVAKTSNLIGADLKILETGIQNLALKIPLGTIELLKIAESAGQLGVTGAENIVKFTETVAKLGSATNIVGQEGATQLARMLNVTGEAIGRVDQLGSVITSLGNSMATTEAEILATGLEVAKASAVFGVGSVDAAAFGASLSSIGVQAELASSSIGMAFRAIDKALRSGGEELAELEELVGMSGDKIDSVFRRNAPDALVLFLRGLKRVQDAGGDTTAELDKFGLSGQRILKVLPTMAKNVDKVAEAFDKAREEAVDMNALNQEAERAADTLGSQLSQLGNTFQVAAERGFGFNEELKNLVKLANEGTKALFGLKEASASLNSAGFRSPFDPEYDTEKSRVAIPPDYFNPTENRVAIPPGLAYPGPPDPSLRKVSPADGLGSGGYDPLAFTPTRGSDMVDRQLSKTQKLRDAEEKRAEDAIRNAEQLLVAGQRELDLLTATDAQRDSILAAQDLELAGVLKTDAAYAGLLDRLTDQNKKHRELIDLQAEEAERMQMWSDLAVGAWETIAGGIFAAVEGTKSWGDALDDIIKKLGEMAIQELVIKQIGGLIAGAFAPSPQKTVGGGLAGGTFAAKGATFSRGEVTPFSLGGIPDIGNQPAYFRMPSGRMGSLRERTRPGGEEAIVPLYRNAQGELGVRSAGGGGGGSPTIIHDNRRVSMVVQTPDVDGFKRSHKQVIRRMKDGLN